MLGSAGLPAGVFPRKKYSKEETCCPRPRYAQYERPPNVLKRRSAMSRENRPARNRNTATHTWPLLLRIEDVERELGVVRRDVYALIHAGRLDLVKIGPYSSRITSERLVRLAREYTKPGPLPENLRRKRSIYEPPTS